MDKDRYKELRKNSNFIFLYYIERGGVVKQEAHFLKFLKLWFANMNIEWRMGILTITRHLDEKYQHIKK